MWLTKYYFVFLWPSFVWIALLRKMTTFFCLFLVALFRSRMRTTANNRQLAFCLVLEYLALVCYFNDIIKMWQLYSSKQQKEQKVFCWFGLVSQTQSSWNKTKVLSLSHTQMEGQCGNKTDDRGKEKRKKLNERTQLMIKLAMIQINILRFYFSLSLSLALCGNIQRIYSVFTTAARA